MTLASPPPPAETKPLRRWLLSSSGLSLSLCLTGELAEAELRHDDRRTPGGQRHSATIQMPDEAPPCLPLAGPTRPGPGGAADAGG